jgi:hypothetical protein
MSSALEAEAVAEELHAALAQPDMRLVIVFCAADRDIAALAGALKRRFAPVPVIGCTTAGEIGPLGYRRASVVGISLAAPEFTAAPVLLRDLESFHIGTGQTAVRQAMQAVLASDPDAKRDRMFAFTLIDGLSGCEEAVVSSLHAVLGEIQLFGGSAGDGLRFERTLVIHDGEVHPNCALFVLVATELPFRVFKTEHFMAGREKMVVTEADPARRIVTEINAEPAAQEYARMVGLKPTALTPMVFANHPVVVRVGGNNFVRSIQKMNGDGSLTFFCAIDEGIVLTVAQGIDLAENLTELFTSLRQELGAPALVLGFDCILRGLEMDEKCIRDDVGRMMMENNVVGFSTYGEQYQAMHVNQTFTGVAIGARRRT